MGSANVDPSGVAAARVPSDDRSARPRALVPVFGSVPTELRRHARFVLWRYERDPSKNLGEGGWTKIPYRADGHGRASSTNAATWATFEAVRTAFERGEHEADGIGWVIGEGVTGGDVDACRDPGTGELTPEAAAIIAEMNTYTEISPSGTGVRFFAFGTLPPKGRKRGVFEMYDGDGGRYLTVTGHHIEGTPDTIEPRDAELAAIHARHIAPPPRPSSNGERQRRPAAGKGAHLSDADVLERMRAKNAKAAALYDGDMSAYASPETGKPDHSAADQALCSFLAFWCDYDPVQVDRLFRASALMRPKWYRPARLGELYGEGTIRRAMEGKGPGDGYRPATSPSNLGRVPGDPGPSEADAPPDADAMSTTTDATTNREPWPTPRALPRANPTPPRLDPTLLPEPLRAYLMDAAELASLPLDYYVPAALVGLSTLVGNRFRIQPKQHDDFTVVPNLWGCLVAHSGTMKSGASTVALAPLEDLQRELQTRYEQAQFANAPRVEHLELIAEGLRDRRKQAARNQGGIDRDSLDSLTAEIVDAERDIAELRVARPTLRVNDPTVERLVELLRDNPRGIAVIRDELIGWLRNLAKQGREGDRSFYLEGWNGDQGHEQERVGRGDTNAPIVTLGVYGTIQPGALAPYQRGAMENGEEADGLLQRFQVLVYPGPLDPFENVDRRPDYSARARVHRLYRELYHLDPAAYADEPPSGFVGFGSSIPGEDFGVLRFDHGAQGVYDEWRWHLENRLRFPTETQSNASAYISHLSKYRSLVPSLAGLFHLVNLVCTSPTSETNRQNRQNPGDATSTRHPNAVTRTAGTDTNRRNPGDLLIATDTLCTAIAFADYLEAHARRLYADELDARRNTAAGLLDRIVQGQVTDGTPIREIARRGWAGLDRDGLTNAMADLEAHGWVRVERIAAGPKGGRPSDVVRLHPELHAHLAGGAA